MKQETKLEVDGVMFRAIVGDDGDHNLIGAESLVEGKVNWWAKSSVQVLMVARWLEGVGTMIAAAERQAETQRGTG